MKEPRKQTLVEITLPNILDAIVVVEYMLEQLLKYVEHNVTNMTKLTKLKYVENNVIDMKKFPNLVQEIYLDNKEEVGPS
jgi:hypothetical protein